jgi:hypothetical protein
MSENSGCGHFGGWQSFVRPVCARAETPSDSEEIPAVVDAEADPEEVDIPEES